MFPVLAVSPEQVEELWRPQVGFINTDDIQHTLVDRDAVTTILRRHPSFVRDLSNPYEGETPGQLGCIGMLEYGVPS